MWTSLRKKLDISEQDDDASLKCQCGRHIVAACVCGDINNSARGSDVTRVTYPMVMTGELQHERRIHNHTHTQKHSNTHTRKIMFQ